MTLPKKSRLFATVLAALSLAAGLVWWLLPRPALRPDPWQGSAAFYDDSGKKLLRLTLSPDEKYRLWVPLSGISRELLEATLLQEDRHFRMHPGVDPTALVRAGWETWVRRSRRMGGSTITMQLARTRFGLDTTHVGGKVLQILRALQIERHYSKDEILEAYLNLVPYGGNIEGVGAASLIYFGKPASNLTLAETLTLVVVPQNPVKRSPAGKADGALVSARRALLEQWRGAHPADQGRDVFLDDVKVRSTADLPFLAPHFIDAELARGFPAGDGRVRTTLDAGLQKLLERQMHGYLEEEHPLGIRNGAMLLVDSRSMEVKALVGSAGHEDDSIDGQVNGTKARRSPGSTLKPFVYALAFEQGLAHPHTMLKDSPTTFATFSPENSDGAFLGPISAKDALVHSRNVPAVELASRLDPSRNLFSLLKSAHVEGLREESFYGLAIVLGGAEVSMEDLVRLYATLANGGRLRPLRTRPSDPLDPLGEPLLSPESAFMALDSLADNPRPDGVFGSARQSGLRVAWKTGTSHGFRDAWTVGVIGPYVLAVWLGNFEGEGNEALVGVKATAPLFFRVADALAVRPEVRAQPEPRAEAGANLARVDVCAISGGLPQPWCPHRVKTWFIPGVSPIRMCDVHRQVAVDRSTGKRACDPTRPGLAVEVAEFWPSDLQKLFRLAGIPRKQPPAEDPRCPLTDLAASGFAPVITSPRKGVEYALESHAPSRTVELSAVADGDVRTIYWFLDETFLGASKNGETLSWNPRAGEWIVRAVDDHGRADARTIHVTRVD